MVLKVHKDTVIPSLSNGCEAWTLRADQISRKQEAEMRLLCRVTGYTFFFISDTKWNRKKTKFATCVTNRAVEQRFDRSRAERCLRATQLKVHGIAGREDVVRMGNRGSRWRGWERAKMCRVFVSNDIEQYEYSECAAISCHFSWLWRRYSLELLSTEVRLLEWETNFHTCSPMRHKENIKFKYWNEAKIHKIVSWNPKNLHVLNELC